MYSVTRCAPAPFGVVPVTPLLVPFITELERTVCSITKFQLSAQSAQRAPVSLRALANSTVLAPQEKYILKSGKS